MIQNFISKILFFFAKFQLLRTFVEVTFDDVFLMALIEHNVTVKYALTTTGS